MALINCPKCNKRISSKAAECNHCSVVIGSIDSEQLENMKRITVIEQSQKIMNQSMIAMLLFCGGFGFMFWGEPTPNSWQYSIATATSVIGFVWYIVNRVRIILLKRNSRNI